MPAPDAEEEDDGAILSVVLTPSRVRLETSCFQLSRPELRAARHKQHKSFDNEKLNSSELTGCAASLSKPK